MATPSVRDHRINTPLGEAHARQWLTVDAAGKAPVLLLHDSLGCTALWRQLPLLLAQASGRSVISYDRPGFGQSAPRTAPPSLEFVAEEAEQVLPALLAHFALERFIAMGHSVGGGMAVHCAARYPANCEGLITLAAQAFVEPRTREGIAEAKRQFDDPAHFARLARYHGDRARWVLDAWTASWLSPGFDDWSLDATLPAVRCPALVIHGKEDEYGSTAQAQRIASLLGGPSRLWLLDGTGHVPHREQEALVLDGIVRFLAALPA